MGRDKRTLDKDNDAALSAHANALVDMGFPYAEAVKALEADIVSRQHHLTVGSAGQKWLLRTLSEEGKHDTALQVALQTSEPSWGHWISQGATTCWENWSGFADDAHPPTPTHNHIFLCGGVGEWMYEYLGGIRPTAPGYETVSIKPAISKTVGPSSVNMTLSTVRGRITSHWTRYLNGTTQLKVEVPVGVIHATLELPLLGRDPSEVKVDLNGKTIWDRESSSQEPQDGLLTSCKPVQRAGGAHGMGLMVLPGAYDVRVVV